MVYTKKGGSKRENEGYRKKYSRRCQTEGERDREHEIDREEVWERDRMRVRGESNRRGDYTDVREGE